MTPNTQQQKQNYIFFLPQAYLCGKISVQTTESKSCNTEYMTPSYMHRKKNAKKPRDLNVVVSECWGHRRTAVFLVLLFSVS